MTSVSDSRVTLFLLSGARPDVFEYLVARGELPSISRYFLESGNGRVVPATTVFPSATGVGFLPFLTGCYPGTCNVPGSRWLDRMRYAGQWWRDRAHVRSYFGFQGRKLNSDVTGAIPSLFDLEPDSVGVCTAFSKGLHVHNQRLRWQRVLLGALAHCTGGYGVLDRAVARALRKLALERHRLVVAVFPGLDGMTRFTDPWHPAVLDMYRQFDDAVEEYAQADGFSGDHLALLASDHGASRVECHTDISLVLESEGVPVLRHPLLWRANPGAAVMVSGNGSAQVYCRPGVLQVDRWSLSEIDGGNVPGIPSGLVSRLARLEGVALVAGRDGPDVVVVNREGRARLSEEPGDVIRYTPETCDVLELSGQPLALDNRGWLEHSYNGAYPDGPTQLVQLFRSTRSGDLVVAAGPGADLRRDWEIPLHRSGQGSLTAAHMRCLLVANRPVAGVMRTVDVFPLVLHHLGHDIPAGIDGRRPSLAESEAA